MKPPGLGFALRDGAVVLQVTRSNRAVDAIYSAVQEAIEAGFTVDQFRAEARECWSIVLDEMSRDADKAWQRK